MVYEKDEKEKMDLLLEMFRAFLREQDYFDIVYSEKLGYLRIVPGNEHSDDQVFRISNFDELLSCLVDDMIFDRMYPNFTPTPSPVDFEAVRRGAYGRLVAGLDDPSDCAELLLSNWMDGIEPLSELEALANLTTDTLQQQLCSRFPVEACTLSVVKPL